ncbi:MAG TPA: hypothetical protein VM659_28775 [Dongiaceae bacterium]|nr:hypothetical protein [Dongiaceae bacterium]
MLDLRDSHDISTPTPGLYKMRIIKRGPWVPVKIEFRPSRDSETSELLDRSPSFHALLGDEDVPIDKVWPWCAGEPIPEAEYNWRVALRQWAIKHAPDEPEATPRKPVDLRQMPPIFGGSRK